MARQVGSWMAVVLVLAGSSLLGGMLGSGAARASASGGDTEINDSLRTFTRVLHAIEENYADPVNLDKAVYSGAIPGMLRTLDPHSSFFDPRNYQTIREDQQGKYYGVGMTVGPRSGQTIVIEPFVGSPAYRAGIRPGDIIAKINGKATANLSTTEVADQLRGPKGTQVLVTILREGVEQPIELTIIRDEIPRHSVALAFEVAPRIGYIAIRTFNGTTTTELAEKLKALDQKTLKGLILDLRANPGGLLNEGVSVADMFLHERQVIVSHRGRSSPERTYRAPNGNKGQDYPLVVLIDRYSASASEIVAGAMQDHDRGLVVGETSFGKGLVQTVYPLGENTGLALTTAKYYTPSGRLIQRDYKSGSLYDYYYANQEKDRNKENHEGQQVRTTDGGRLVYGGGGIAPDVRVETPKLAKFQQELDFRFTAFFNFGKAYLGRRDSIPRDFQVTDEVLSEFKAFLDKNKIPFTENDFAEHREWVTRKIRQELIGSIYGRPDADKIQIEADPVVRRALELMPQARELADKVKRIMAQRMGRED